MNKAKFLKTLAKLDTSKLQIAIGDLHKLDVEGVTEKKIKSALNKVSREHAKIDNVIAKLHTHVPEAA